MYLALAEFPHEVVDVLVVGISTMAVVVKAVVGSKVVAIKVVAVEVAGTNMVAGAVVDAEEDIPLPMAMALGILPISPQMNGLDCPETSEMPS